LRLTKKKYDKFLILCLLLEYSLVSLQILSFKLI